MRRVLPSIESQWRLFEALSSYLFPSRRKFDLKRKFLFGAVYKYSTLCRRWKKIWEVVLCVPTPPGSTSYGNVVSGNESPWLKECIGICTYGLGVSIVNYCLNKYRKNKKCSVFPGIPKLWPFIVLVEGGAVVDGYPVESRSRWAFTRNVHIKDFRPVHIYFHFNFQLKMSQKLSQKLKEAWKSAP